MLVLPVSLVCVLEEVRDVKREISRTDLGRCSTPGIRAFQSAVPPLIQTLDLDQNIHLFTCKMERGEGAPSLKGATALS